MRVYVALEWWPTLKSWEAEPETSQADALDGVARALKRGHRAVMLTADLPDVVSSDVPVVAAHIAGIEAVSDNNSLTVSPDAKREANTSGGIGSP